MVRKVRIALVIVALLCAVSTGAHATSYTVYEGNMNTTYVNYFRDIASGLGFSENYVAFRSGEFSYTMVVGKLQYDNGIFTLAEEGTMYEFSTGNTGYSSVYKYDVSSIADFELVADDNVVYTDLGKYPQLVSIGEKYEVLQTFTLCAVVLFALCIRIFGKR